MQNTHYALRSLNTPVTACAHPQIKPGLEQRCSWHMYQKDKNPNQNTTLPPPALNLLSSETEGNKNIRLKLLQKGQVCE